MMKHLLLFMSLLLMVGSHRSHAQSWQKILVMDDPAGSSAIAIAEDGSIYVAAWDQVIASWPARAFIYHIDSDGNVMDSLLVSGPDEISVIWDLHLLPSGLVFSGNKGVIADFNEPDWNHQMIGMAEIDPVLMNAQMWNVGPGNINVATGKGYILNGHFVSGYTLYNFSSNIPSFAYRGFSWDLTTNEVTDVLLNDNSAVYQLVHAASPYQDGHLFKMPRVDPNTSSPCSMVLTNIDLQVTDELPMPPSEIITWWDFQEPLFIEDHISMIARDNGDLVVGGIYRRNELYGTYTNFAVHYLNGSADSLHLHVFGSDLNVVNTPAGMNSLAELGDGSFVAGYTRNTQGGTFLPMLNEPSSIHIVRMDSTLTPFSEYVFDGHATNTYYYLVDVKAMEGALFLTGTVFDLDAPELDQRAWVARIELSEFTGISAAKVPSFMLYPNPGSDRIKVRPSQLSRGYFHIMDATGKSIRSAVAYNGGFDLDVSQLALGMYILVINSEGPAREHLRFIKE